MTVLWFYCEWHAQVNSSLYFLSTVQVYFEMICYGVSAVIRRLPVLRLL